MKITKNIASLMIILVLIIMVMYFKKENSGVKEYESYCYPIQQPDVLLGNGDFDFRGFTITINKNNLYHVKQKNLPFEKIIKVIENNFNVDRQPLLLRVDRRSNYKSIRQIIMQCKSYKDKTKKYIECYFNIGENEQMVRIYLNKFTDTDKSKTDAIYILPSNYIYNKEKVKVKEIPKKLLKKLDDSSGCVNLYIDDSITFERIAKAIESIYLGETKKYILILRKSIP